jgi:hypothetical protein
LSADTGEEDGAGDGEGDGDGEILPLPPMLSILKPQLSQKPSVDFTS